MSTEVASDETFEQRQDEVKAKVQSICEAANKALGDVYGGSVVVTTLEPNWDCGQVTLAILGARGGYTDEQFAAIGRAEVHKFISEEFFGPEYDESWEAFAMTDGKVAIRIDDEWAEIDASDASGLSAALSNVVSDLVEEGADSSRATAAIAET